MSIQPSTIQLVWAVIEASPSQELLELSDPVLISKLMDRVSAHLVLERPDREDLKRYITARLPLIKDITMFKRMSIVTPTSSIE